jgi:hypothetical protein
VIKLDVLSCFLAVTFLFYTTHTIPILFYAAYPLLLHHNLQYQQYHDQPPYRTPRLSDTTAILRAEATRQQSTERLFHQILTPTNSTLAPHPIVIMVQFKPTITGGRTEREKHRQPPLTLASSRLRLEALTAFYKCVKFEWHFKWHFKYGFHCGEEELPFSEDSCDLLSMPAASLSQMKNFGVH